MHANLEVWDVELVVGGEVVGSCGGCHHFVPCLLAGLVTRSRDQPKLCHGYSSGAAKRKLRGGVYLDSWHAVLLFISTVNKTLRNT